MEKSRKAQNSTLRSPQLKRVVLLSIDAKHRPCKAPDGLISHFKNRIWVELLEPIETNTSPRIRIGVDVNGKWYMDKESDPVITFEGGYEGRFDFGELVVTMDDVVSWLSDDFYRQSLVAQVIPVVNTHVHAQLEMMGVRTNRRPLGFAPESIISETASKKAKPRRRVKKVALAE